MPNDAAECAMRQTRTTTMGKVAQLIKKMSVRRIKGPTTEMPFELKEPDPSSYRPICQHDSTIDRERILSDTSYESH